MLALARLIRVFVSALRSIIQLVLGLISAWSAQGVKCCWAGQVWVSKQEGSARGLGWVSVPCGPPGGGQSVPQQSPARPSPARPASLVPHPERASATYTSVCSATTNTVGQEKADGWAKQTPTAHSSSYVCFTPDTFPSMSCFHNFKMANSLWQRLLVSGVALKGFVVPVSVRLFYVFILFHFLINFFGKTNTYVLTIFNNLHACFEERALDIN